MDLRCEVLGWPRAFVPGDEAGDTLHVAARDEQGRAEGVVSFMPHTYPDAPADPAIYFWGMAVRQDRQLRGTGSMLLAYVLSRGQVAGTRFVWADARESAVPFYRKLGGTPIGSAYSDTITGMMDRRVVFELLRDRS